LYKGATPPAVAWAAIDSVLLGSLYNYRLILRRHGMTEPTPGKGGIERLSLLGHGIAGLGAGLTRYASWDTTMYEVLTRALQRVGCYPSGTFERYALVRHQVIIAS